MNDLLSEKREVVNRLLVALGLESMQQWGDEELLVYMTDRWLGGEHGPGSGKDEFSDAEVSGARPILDELGLTLRVVPASGQDFDEVVILGAAGIGIYRRLALSFNFDLACRRWTLLAGQRPHSGLDRDGAIDELLAPRGRFKARQGWTPPGELSYQADMALNSAELDPLRSAQLLIPSERALAELILDKLISLGPGNEVSLPPPTELEIVTNELGQREYTVKVWPQARFDDRKIVVRLFDCLPVDRGDRPPRPTTVSSVAEWLDYEGGPATGASVLFLANQPHTNRVALDLRKTMADLGRQDLEIYTAGDGALPDASIHLLLGEIPATVHAERRLHELTA